MARWQRFNPEKLREIRERHGWSPEQMAVRLRIWQAIDRLDTELFPGAGLVALRSLIDQDTVEGLNEGQIAAADTFLGRVLTTLSKGPVRGGLSNVTIRRWEAGQNFPQIPQLHILCDALNIDAGELFEPAHPGRPRTDLDQAHRLAKQLAPVADAFREESRPAPRRPPGRPRGLRKVPSGK